MPRILASTYVAPRLLRDGHAQTVYPTLSRRVAPVPYDRQRVVLSDGDFVDVDHSRVGARRVAVVSHGLEGHSRRPYVLGMARAFNTAGWDVAAWNFRGCSGEANRLLKFTHSGASSDLAEVIDAVLGAGRHDKLVAVGFSLGGNLTLKYLGERGSDLPRAVVGGVAFSVPTDLRGSAERMARPANRLYMRRFLSDLRGRMTSKAAQFPGRVSLEGYDGIRDFRGFDERYTAPLHGFLNADDYWARSSANAHLRGIRVPALLVNAMDDPFLSEGCFPWAEAEASTWLHLEAPEHGGHVGFVSFGSESYWSERRATEFASAL